MYKKILIICMVLLLSSVSVSSALTQSEIEAIVVWAGCEGATIQLMKEGHLGAWFDPSSIHLIFQGLDQVSDPIQVGIVLHETAHCLQDQQGILHFPTDPQQEKDADRIAVIKGCEWGISPTWMPELGTWFAENQNYFGDRSHGSFADRIAHALMDLPEICKWLLE